MGRLLLLAAWLAAAWADSSCRLDGSCTDPTELVQKAINPTSAYDNIDADDDVEGLSEDDFPEAARQVVKDLEPLSDASWEPLMKFAQGDMKDIEKELLPGRISKMTIPIHTGPNLDIDVAQVQSEVRTALQNWDKFPSPVEALPLVVKGLGLDSNISLPRGAYLSIAEGLAEARHRVQQDTALQDMVISLLPSMSQLASDKSLFEPMESVHELAEKRRFWPEGKSSAGGRDVASRMADMAKQNVRSIKFMKPALDHAINGSLALDQRTTTGRDGFCQSVEQKRVAETSAKFKKKEAKLKNCKKEEVNGVLTNTAWCLDFDPTLKMVSLLLNQWKPKSKQAGVAPAGLAIELNVGLSGTLSGSTYRRWREYVYRRQNEKDPAVKVRQALQTSQMFLGFIVRVHWQGLYPNGKAMGVQTEFNWAFKQPDRQQSPLQSVAVMLTYGQGKPKTTQVEKRRVYTPAFLNFAMWGTVMNSRVIGDTAVALIHEPAKRKTAGQVRPRFGVKIGNYEWSSTWPMALASNWWWRSHWEIAPRRKFAGLASAITLPFLADCVVEKKAALKARQQAAMDELKQLKEENEGKETEQRKTVSDLEDVIKRLQEELQNGVYQEAVEEDDDPDIPSEDESEDDKEVTDQRQVVGNPLDVPEEVVNQGSGIVQDGLEVEKEIVDQGQEIVNDGAKVGGSVAKKAADVPGEVVKEVVPVDNKPADGGFLPDINGGKKPFDPKNFDDEDGLIDDIEEQNEAERQKKAEDEKAKEPVVNKPPESRPLKKKEPDFVPPKPRVQNLFPPNSGIAQQQED